MPNQFGPIYMAPAPFLTSTHIERVVSQPDGHGFLGIKLYFTRKGAAIARRVSAANLGKHLVFLLAGKPIFAPRIEEPISSNFTRIDGFLTQAQIDAFVSAVPAK
jgi:preprotein translocase subunit SecD